MEGLAPPPTPPPLADTIEGGRYRDKVLKYIENAQPGHFENFLRELVNILRHQQNPTGKGIFEGRARRTPEQIESLILGFFAADDCFREIRRRLDTNFGEQNAIMPGKYRGDNCAWDYLKDTPPARFRVCQSPW